MDLSSSSSQSRRRSGINNRPNPIGAKTSAPRGPVIYDRSLQQPFTAQLLNEIRAPA